MKAAPSPRGDGAPSDLGSPPGGFMVRQGASRAVEARILSLGMLAVLAVAATSQGAAPAETWHVVRYDGPIPTGEREALEALAGPVLDPVPPFGYALRLSEDERALVAAREGVAGIEPLRARASASLDDAPRAPARILLFPDADAGAFAAHLAREGAQLVAVPASAEPLVDATLAPGMLAHLLAHPEVRWIEALPARAELDNARASSIVQSGTNDAWSLHDIGVNGSSQIVAFCDTGLDTDAPLATLAGRATHDLFSDGLAPLVHQVPSSWHRKVALYYSPVDGTSVRGDMDDVVGHGTHVAGTLAGDAGAWGARDGHDGVAFAARLAVCDASRGHFFQAPADHAPYFQPAYDVGARVHSNSWGTMATDEYTLAARQQDAYAWTHRDLVILRSAGNLGEDGMRAEALAKNVLAVGATTNDALDERVTDFSSRGPAADGRVKPDLVAPGSCITSADLAGPSSYACLDGTSFSTPVVAGAATLVRDLFAKQDPPRDVSSALVRALLVASAQPIAADGPDAAEGWGRPQLGDAVEALALVHDEDAALVTGASWNATVVVPEGATLRVVLAWTDAPAPPGASITLVNDLDLQVVTPEGAILAGNADLAAPDRANVIERVLADDLAAGNYTIRVKGWNVPMGPQPFALVVLA